MVRDLTLIPPPTSAPARRLDEFQNRIFPHSSHLKVAMPFTPFPPLVNLQEIGWNPERVAAVNSIAAPNNERIALAALTRLELYDHIAAFALWCDIQALDRQ
ncbi:hypothetical protein [Rhodoferax ferrireducens]|uniref:hypothetical protein n=1 Tax=Rhodoferax ferrireducens TaxID=192843 RepID=UPI00140F7655|nr:hypothetical protein [Rhodoferax ferrireducens]